MKLFQITSSGTNEGKLLFPIYVHTYQVYMTPDFLQFLLTNK